MKRRSVHSMLAFIASFPLTAISQDGLGERKNLELPLCIESAEGVFVVHFAAIPQNSKHQEQEYLAWWQGRKDDVKLYLYPHLISGERDVIRALTDLQNQFSVRTDILAADFPFLAKGLVGERPIVHRSWELATQELALSLMGFQPATPRPGQLGSIDEGLVAATCPPPGDMMMVGMMTEPPPRGEFSPDQVIGDAVMAAACGGGCSGSCCNMSCNDGNSCTHDYCVNGVCFHQNKPNGSSCESDEHDCTTDTCSGGMCMHYTICPNIGDYCTDEQCLNGTCLTLDGTLGCPATFVVDSEGHPRETPYTRSACAVIPMGTDCVRVRIWYFSREYPQFTGTGSQFNDTLQYEISVPGQELQYGSTNVNDLHSAFDEDGYYLVSDQQYHLSSWTDYDPIEIRMRATATNIRDNQLGSAVIFEIRCDTVDVDYDSVAEIDELDPGGFLCLNDDDDNQNDIPDMDEPGQVVGEDDLVPVVISSTMPLYPGLVDFGATSGSSRVRFYANPDRTDLLWGTQYWTPQELPKTVYVEGIYPSAQPRDTTLRARRASCEDKVFLTVGNAEYRPIEILYKTFIECEVAHTLPDPTLYDFFAGDNRSFGYGYSVNKSRTYQLARASLNHEYANGKITEPLQRTGITRGYDDHPDFSDVTPLPAPMCGGNCAYTFVPGATAECEKQINEPTPSQMSVLHRRVDTQTIMVQLVLNVGDQCEWAVPRVNATLTILFRHRCANGMPGPLEFKLSGTYDGYPWHELYLNGALIFTHDPCVTGEGPMSMFGGTGEHLFENHDAAHPPLTGVPLGQWQPFPGTN